jgi:hypothetical protein
MLINIYRKNNKGAIILAPSSFNQVVSTIY